MLKWVLVHLSDYCSEVCWFCLILSFAHCFWVRMLHWTFLSLVLPSFCLPHSTLPSVLIPQSPTRCLSLLSIGEPWHQSVAVISRALSWQGCVMFFFCFCSMCTWHMGLLSKCLLDEQIPSFLNSCSASAHNPLQTFILSLCLRYISGNACLLVTEKTGSIWLKRKGFYWLTDCKPRDEADLETESYQMSQHNSLCSGSVSLWIMGVQSLRFSQWHPRSILRRVFSWKSLGTFSLYFTVWPGSLVCSRSILQARKEAMFRQIKLDLYSWQETRRWDAIGT